MEHVLQSLVTLIETCVRSVDLGSYVTICVTFGAKTSVDLFESYATLDDAIAGETEAFQGFLEDARELADILTRQVIFIVGPKGIERVLRWETPDTMLICQPDGATLTVLSSVTA